MDISLLLSSVSGAVDLGRLLVNERDRQKAAAIQSELTDKLIQAQSQISQVLVAIIDKDGTIKTLSDRVRELESEQDERVRYQLAKLGSAGDFFAYGLRPAGELRERADEPAHFLCQPCFDGGGKKVVLTSNGEGYWYCPVCKHGAQTTQQDLSMFDRVDDSPW